MSIVITVKCVCEREGEAGGGEEEGREGEREREGSRPLNTSNPQLPICSK